MDFDLYTKSSIGLNYKIDIEKCITQKSCGIQILHLKSLNVNNNNNNISLLF